ncbi:MAG: sulfite exporter TauE/SafE family protein [Spongiibacteraceae bacterium]
MIWASIILPAFLLGFMGSAHCLGMCGGISAALGAALPTTNRQRTFALSLSYNLGRVLSYTLLGALAGTLAQGLSQPLLQMLPQSARWLRTLAGLMVIAMGFYVAGWWHGLAQLERIGNYLWRHIQPFTRPLLPPKSIGAALLLGELWGFLPCGLVYSSLTWALLHADAIEGAMWMLAFGVGTLPAMLAMTHGGSYVQAWKQRPVFRNAAAIALIAAGIVAAAMPWQHAGHEHHHAATSANPIESMDHHQHAQ